MYQVDFDPPDEKFETYLKEARDTDFSIIESTNCIGRTLDDNGQHVIWIIPSLALKTCTKLNETLKSMLLLFVRTTPKRINLYKMHVE